MIGVKQGWVICCLLFLMFSGCLNIKITELEVPNAVPANSGDVELQCQHYLDPEESTEGLTKKWFFTPDGTQDLEQDRLIFQWIKDFKFSADKKFAYPCNDTLAKEETCGLVLRNPGVAASGTYTCAVSTYAKGAEVRRGQRMIVYLEGEGPDVRLVSDQTDEQTDIPEDATLVTPQDNTTSDTVECEVTGVYPEPELTLYVNDEKIEANVTATLSKEGREHGYTVLARAPLPANANVHTAHLRCDFSLAPAPVNRTFTLEPSFNDESSTTSEANPTESQGEPGARPQELGADDSPGGASSFRPSSSTMFPVVLSVVFLLLQGLWC